MSTTKDFIDSIQAASKERTSAYDTTATVKRVEGNTAWVHIPGGVDETPVKLTISAKEGDQVQVRVSGGSAFMVGNGTNPPTDDARANEAYTVATVAEGAAENALANASRAKEAADSAQASASAAESAAGDAVIAAGNAQTAAGNAQQSADSALVSLATAQDVVGVLNWITAHGTMTLTSDVTVNPAHVYFVVDPTGDYVVGGTHYSIVNEPKDAELSTYYELTVDESVQNYVATHIVVDTEGLWIVPDAGGNKVLIATGSGSTYMTAGTYIIGKVNNVDTVFAQFTKNGMTTNATSGTQIAHLGYGQGQSESGTATAPYYSLGIRTGAIGNYSLVQGYDNTASGYASHAEGSRSIASEKYAHAEGGSINYNGTTRYSTASGYASHAEGIGSIASGNYSHAEGEVTTANGVASHSEGLETTAGNTSHAEGLKTTADNVSHAEGVETTASGSYSHAEGADSTATGACSHAQNRDTIAAKANQTAIGKWNVEDTEATASKQKALIIGNGTADDARSNALTVDWNGNVDIASGAKYKINGTALSASDVGAEPTLTNISESGGTYSGGIEDEKLLTTATITKWQTILGI